MNAIINYFKTHWLLFIILVGGITLRLLPLFTYQFSHDELSGLSRTKYENLTDLFHYGVKTEDTHPALIQLFLWLWVKLVGYNEIAIKLPFLICGILSIWYMYKLGLTFFDKKVGLLSASVISFSFIFLIYSSYARMYITGILFSILFLYAVFSILFLNNVKPKHYLQFIVFALLCAYNHHLSCFFAFTVVALSFIFIKKTNLKHYFISCIITVVLYLPHLPITLFQFNIGGIGATVGGWLPPPRPTEIYYFIKALLGTGYAGILSSIFFLSCIVISVFKLIPISKKQIFLFLIFVINYTVIHLYSVYKNPILQFSCLLFCGICLILLVSSFTSFLKLKYSIMLCLSIIVILNFQSIIKKHVLTKAHIHDFESQAKTAFELKKIYSADSVICIFTGEPFYISIYEQKYNTPFKSISIQDTMYDSEIKLTNYLKQLTQPYIVIGAVSPMQLQLIKKYYPNLVSHHEDYYRNTTVLSKKYQSNIDVSVLEQTQLFNSDCKFYVNSKKPFTFYGDSINYKLDSTDKEFPFNINLPLYKSNLQFGQYLIAELTIITDTLSFEADDKLCISVSDNNHPTVFYTAQTFNNSFVNKNKTQTISVSFFAGNEFEKWKQKNLIFHFFLWKQKKSNYTICNFTVKRFDYNPSKWTVFN